MVTVERLKILIKEFSKSERDFSLKLGINPTTLNFYMLGKRKVSLEVVESILDTYPNISAEWLLRGIGTMTLDDEVYSGDIDEAFYKRIIDELLDTISVFKKRVKELESLNSSITHGDS